MSHENIFYPFFTHSPLKIVKRVEVVESTECFRSIILPSHPYIYRVRVGVTSTSVDIQTLDSRYNETSQYMDHHRT